MIYILLFALLGLWVGGLGGLLAGAAVGYVVSHLAPRLLRRGLGLVQAQYLEATYAVMGALCKADGRVTRDEIKAVEALFERMRLSAEQREMAKAAFTRGKSPGFDLDAEIAKVARICRGQGMLMRMFLQVQLVAISADGALHPSEHDMLVRVARGLGLAEADVAQLEAMLRASSGGPSTQAQLADAYQALGVPASADNADVKRAYRRLMSENHPDKLAGKGLPESMRALAEERTRELTVAYGLIKDARQMT